MKTTARIVPGGPFPQGVAQGGELDATLQPFDVLNLETGDFNADFTGSLIDASGPVAVYVGSEASDAPFYSTLLDRSCCADHLETQLAPVRAVGTRYVVGHVPNRAQGARRGRRGLISPFDEPEVLSGRRDAQPDHEDPRRRSARRSTPSSSTDEGAERDADRRAPGLLADRERSR